ncbi:MAG: type II secretion system F family protein [Planctomycetota bacterium]
MPDFAYKALTSRGTASEGRIEAASRAAAVQLLSQRGEFVLEMDEHVAGVAVARASGGWTLSRSRITPRQRLALLRQLSVALDAGLTLVVALKVVADQADTPSLRALATELIEEVRRGEALSDAMRTAGSGRVFSTMQVSMVRAGETAGALEEVMASLTKFAERDLAVREKLRSAAIYPVLVLALALVSIVIILTFILPSIMASLEDTGADLPLPTVILIQASDTLRSPWGLVLLAALVGGGIAFWRWRKTAAGRLALDGWKLRLPVLGVALRKVAVARFARVLGTLSAAGIGIVESMRIVRDTLGNEVLAQRIDHAAEEIVRGRSIAEPLGEDGMFPPLLVQVVAMGERTGKLDVLLTQLADTYEQETEVALGRVMSVLPAVLILGLAIVVAFILAAALLPIVNMSLAG